MPGVLAALLSITSTAYAAWVPQTSGVTASLRGVSAVSHRVAWATGTKGTVLLTTDGGAHWLPRSVPAADALDFRDVEATGQRGVVLLASGPGDKSRIYRTVDRGATWTLALTNPDPSGFFDAIAFFNNRRGLLIGDPVQGHFVIYATSDGSTWVRRPGPEALPGEGAFAASGTCLTVRKNGLAWFGTGAGRVFRSEDFGVTWTAAPTALRHDGAAAGVFSLAFRDARHGIAAGGDYSKPAESVGNLALTDDGGRTWRQPRTPPAGYRSAVAWLSRSDAVATGTSGSDVSADSGLTWQPLAAAGYNALAFYRATGWAVGPEGRIARWR